MTSLKNSQRTKRYAAIIIILIMIMSMCDIFMGINTVNAASSASVSVKLSSEQVKQSSSVTLTAEVRSAGNVSNNVYSFSFGYNTDASNRYSAFGYQSSSVYTLQPKSIDNLKNYTGPVYIVVWAKDSSGNEVFSGTHKILNIIPDDEEILRANGSVTSTGSYTVGDRLLVTMTASGGKSPYKYKYEYAKSGGGYSTYKDYSSASSITMATDSWTANTDYNIRVTVKDSNNDTFSYVSAVRLSAKPVPIPSITSFSVQSTARAGEKIKLNCDAKDGTGTLQYKFTYINPSNTERIIKDYSTSDNTTWDTTGLAEGSYTVKAIVKDGNNKIVSQKSTIRLSRSPTLSPTVSANPADGTVVKGKDITFTVNDHSSDTEDYPPHPYTYKFEYKKKNADSYTNLQNYSSDEKYKLNTRDLSAGDYVLKATVKDNNGKEYSKTCNFTVSVPKITFSISPGSKEFYTGGGDEKAVIEVRDVNGGISDEYEYKFEYVKYGELTDDSLTSPTNDAAWQSIKDFSSESTAGFTVSDSDNAGIYAVRVSVQNKDNDDNSLIYRKIIENYTVKVKVEHTLADINTLINKIDTWYSNSVQGDMEEKLINWSSNNEHYSEYPFSYEDYSSAYLAARNSNFDGNDDYDRLYSNLETQFRKLQNLVNSGYVSPDLETGDTPLGFANSVLVLYKALIGQVTSYLNNLSGNSDVAVESFGFDFNTVADNIFPIFKVIAYSIIIILAGVNALESALQYEMFTMRGGVKILARLVFAKIWVDLSLTICRLLVTLTTEWLQQILDLTNSIADNINVSVHLDSSTAWIIGPIIDVFNGIMLSISLLILIVPLVVLVVVVIIKLFVRSFEIAMLQCISPVFFACLTGETTKQYFNKFILTYLSTVAEVLFMAIVWYTYISYMDSSLGGSSLNVGSTADIFKLESGVLSFVIVSVGAFILMIKPPRILKNLITA